ncbi:MAG: dienelactone hydrolase [Chitinophagaceae bacterium]|nr:dienelactone hydrolase [Chitinophagaceae bacterium]
MKLFNWMAPVLLSAILLSCNGNSSSADESKTTDSTRKTTMIKAENVFYNTDSINAEGFLAYDQNKEGKRPIVIVVHEWWGLTDYAKTRATQLAELGYLAFAADMYGHSKTADNPKDAQNLAMPFYTNPGLFKSRLEAAIAKAKTFPQADTTQIAAIGYCFGGSAVLSAGKLGTPLNGVVSFHGTLAGTPAPVKGLTTQFLVCNGEADGFVKPEDKTTFKKQMDSAGAKYTFKEYPGALHAFTNLKATEMGKKFKMPIAYNGAADTASWKDMKDFFGRIFH